MRAAARRLHGAAGYLYGVPGLATPGCFPRLAAEAVTRSSALVSALQAGPFGESTVRGLDEVSDVVCSVVDAAELCRQTHPSREWAAAAEAAALALHRHVAELNADAGLYGALCAAQAAGPLPPEAASVAASLRSEFERGGITLGPQQRARLAAAQGRGMEAGFAFTRNLGDPRALGTLRLPRGGALVLSADGLASALEGGDRATRRAAWEAASLSPAPNVGLLLSLLAARGEAASCLGFASAAEVAVQGTLAGRSSQAAAFVAALSSALQPAARREAQRMGVGPAGAPPWDRAWLAAGAVEAACGAAAERSACAFFPLHRVLRGLALLTQRLFGVALAPAEVGPGWCWAPGVVALDASHPREGPLGTLFLDLERRPGKPPGAAHFVVRAGRGVAGVLPCVALVASIPGGPSALLRHGVVETLHHEWGHALHSLLSRTAYQHLGGTRGPQDCVEAPSTFFERLAWHPRALQAWAVDGAGRPIPGPLVAALQRGRAATSATDALHQLQLCDLDLTLHGPTPPGCGAALAQAAGACALRHSPWPGAGPGACWPHHPQRVHHLVGYGATYYAYAYGRAMAGAAWRGLDMDSDPLDPAKGSLLWDALLRPGGSADQAHTMERLAGPNALVKLDGDVGWAPDPAAAALDITDIADGG